MAAIFNSMNAGIGNLVAEGNHERIFSVFEELFFCEIFVYQRDVFLVYLYLLLVYNIVDWEGICDGLHDVVINDCYFVY